MKPLDLADAIARRLIGVSGVRAVVLGGSHARGAADAFSDIDLGIYYSGNLDLDGLRGVAGEFAESGEGVTEPGAWGPWIDGGAWLNVDGQKVDWLYRNLPFVECHVRDAAAGKVGCHHQPGHPYGFCTHIYAGEVAACRPLQDPHREVDRLKGLLDPYPDELKVGLAQGFLWQADFALRNAAGAAKRGEASYVGACLYRSAVSMAIVLHGLNERPYLNEKGSLAAIRGMAKAPEGFSEITEAALECPSSDPAQLQEHIEAFFVLLERVRALCDQNS